MISIFYKYDLIEISHTYYYKNILIKIFLQKYIINNPILIILLLMYYQIITLSNSYNI